MENVALLFITFFFCDYSISFPTGGFFSIWRVNFLVISNLFLTRNPKESISGINQTLLFLVNYNDTT